MKYRACTVANDSRSTSIAAVVPRVSTLSCFASVQSVSNLSGKGRDVDFLYCIELSIDNSLGLPDNPVASDTDLNQQDKIGKGGTQNRFCFHRITFFTVGALVGRRHLHSLHSFVDTQKKCQEAL